MTSGDTAKANNLVVRMYIYENLSTQFRTKSYKMSHSSRDQCACATKQCRAEVLYNVWLQPVAHGQTARGPGAVT